MKDKTFSIKFNSPGITMKLSTSFSSLGPLQLDRGLRLLSEPHILPWPPLGITKLVSPVSQQFSSNNTAQAPGDGRLKMKLFILSSDNILTAYIFLGVAPIWGALVEEAKSLGAVEDTKQEQSCVLHRDLRDKNKVNIIKSLLIKAHQYLDRVQRVTGPGSDSRGPIYRPPGGNSELRVFALRCWLDVVYLHDMRHCLRPMTTHYCGMVSDHRVHVMYSTVQRDT